MTVVRLAVVDDHALFRAGLISLLKDMPEFAVVGEAESGLEALELVDRVKPDVLLLDVNMPGLGGIETVKSLRSLPKYEQPHILMLTISKNDQDLMGAISAGADGYLLKSAEPEELRKAILLLNQGMSVISPQVTRKVLNAVDADRARKPVQALSSREMEVLECLVAGRKTQRIAVDLVISENTVKTHIRHIFEKLEVSTRAEAAIKALQLGLITDDRTVSPE
ncbi:response regulator [Chloroflexota bacterium]